MNELELLAREAAGRYGLDPRLICALCEVESSWMPWAVRHEAGYEWLIGFKRAEPRDMPVSFMDIKQQWWRPHPKLARIMPLYSVGLIQTELLAQQTSWGLMQIMGATARERGFADNNYHYNASNKGWLTELCDPQVNLEWGCRHLRWMVDHNNAYGLPDVRISPADLAAAWNGGARIMEFVNAKPTGRYKNQSYVDRVVAAMVNYEQEAKQ